MNSGTIVGHVNVDEFEELDLVGDEQFFTGDIKFDKFSIPLRVSEEYAFDTGKVEVVGYLMTITRNGKLFTCFNVLTIRNVDESTPECLDVELEGKVVKSFPLKPVKKSGNVVKVFAVRYTTADGNHNLIHCVAEGSLARKLASMDKEDIIHAKGRIKPNFKAFEVLVTEVLSVKLGGE